MGRKGAAVFRDPMESDRVWVIFDWDEAGFKNFLSDPEVPAIIKEPVTSVSLSRRNSAAGTAPSNCHGGRIEKAALKSSAAFYVSFCPVTLRKVVGADFARHQRTLLCVVGDALTLSAPLSALHLMSKKSGHFGTSKKYHRIVCDGVITSCYYRSKELSNETQ